MSKVFFYKRNGKITNPKVLRKLFDELPDNGKFTCEVASGKRRSTLQNGYLHGVILPMVFQGLRDAGWNDIKDVHDAKRFIKQLFLRQKIENPETGEVIEIVKDTSDLTTVEMMQFWEEVWQWASEYLGVTIPAPNSQAEINYINGTI